MCSNSNWVGVPFYDPITLPSAALLLIVVALITCHHPTEGAIAVSPYRAPARLTRRCAEMFESVGNL